MSNNFMKAYLEVCNFYQKKFEILICVGCGPQKNMTPKSTLYRKSKNICLRMPCNTSIKAF